MEKGGKMIIKNKKGEILYNGDFANLRYADLRGADLRYADLEGADLENAKLRRAKLRSAYLRGANLEGADLRYADLRGAYLRGVDLRGAKLRGAKLPDYHTCPKKGEFIAWKKGSDGHVIKLKIRKSYKRASCLKSRKCRAEKVYVMSIEDRNGNQVRECEGWYLHEFKYEVGKEVTPDSYDDDIRVECTHGIHFFMTREEAENW